MHVQSELHLMEYMPSVFIIKWNTSCDVAEVIACGHVAFQAWIGYLACEIA